LARLRAAAGVAEGVALGSLGDTTGSMAINDFVIGAFRQSADSDVREHVAWAVVNKGFDLITLERYHEAIELYEGLEELAPFQPPFTIPVAQGLMNWALALEKSGRGTEETALYERIASNLESGPRDDPAAHFLAWALINKAIAVLDRHEYGESVRLCDQVLHRWWNVPTWELPSKVPEALASALRHRAIAMEALGEYEVAIADVDRLLERYPSRTDEGTGEEIAWAMIAKATAQEALHRQEEAMLTCDNLVSRFQSTRGKHIHAAVASARRLREGLERRSLG
jgi:tetratricopeptide (TPR) repeat protein